MLKSLDLAIVDVETTGSSAVYDRVIEVGVLRVQQGRLTQTYSTLINPQRPIPPIITQITGITDEAVADAPAFSEAAARIQACLAGCVFVAHNVRFDYGFLRNEFERAGIAYAADCLCSVRLSRLLYPRHKRHSLSALIERFEFPCVNRHRALDDAAVIWAFFQHVCETIEPESVEKAARQLLKQPLLPARMNPKDIESLPSGPGAYVFYDAEDVPLYVGKSTEVRDRVLAHFSAGTSGKNAALCERAVRVEAQAAFGELGAALLALSLADKQPRTRSRRVRQKIKRIRWPYPGPVKIEERHHAQAQGHLFIVDQWKLVKAFCYDDQGLKDWLSGGVGGDDAYTIFAKYVSTHARNIRPLSQAQAGELLNGVEYAQTASG